MVVTLKEIRELEVRAKSDTREFDQGVQKIVRGSEQIVSAYERSTVAGEKVTNSLISIASGYSSLEKRFVAGAKEAASFDSAINNLGRAIRQNGYDAERADKILAGLYSRYKMTADAARIRANGELELAEAVERANAAFRVSPVTGGDLMRMSGPTTSGPITGNDYGRLAARQYAGGYPVSHPVVPANQNIAGVRGFEAANIGYQFQDIAVTAAMGMNPLMIGLQQGTQIASTFGGMGAAGAVSTLAAAFTSLISPVSLATIGITAGAAALIQYGSAWFDGGGDEINEALREQNQLIGNVANRWGEALPHLSAYAKQLEQIAAKKDSSEAADVAARQQFAGAQEALGNVSDEFERMILTLNGNPKSVQFANDLTASFQGLVQNLAEGKATASDLVNVQSSLSAAMATGSPYVRNFGDSFSVVAQKIREAIGEMTRFRNEDRALSGLDMLNKYGGRGVYDNVFRSSDFTMQNNLLPEYGPVPTRRPLRELEADPASRQIAEMENRRRMFQAEMAAMTARSPSEKEAAARAREEANVIDGENETVRLSRISLAGTRARVEAEYQLAEAQKERMRGLNESVQWQQMEISLLGKTQGEMVALQSAYSMISRVREEAARNNIRVDERELAMIQQKATELGRLADLYARLQLRGELQFERDQLFRSDQDQQIASRLRSSGLAVDFESAEAKMIRENMRISELRSDLKGFFSDFRDGLMQGESFGEALGNAILNALSNSLTRWTDRLFDSAITSLLGGGSGSPSSFTPNTTLGAFLGAANDNRMGGYSGLGASQAVATGAQSITGGAVDLAMRMLGQTETANAGSINAFMAAGGVDLDAATSAWCAGFVNSALKQIGVDGTGSSVANSFQDWGRLVNPSDVMRGDVLLQSRGLGASSLGGHVGLATGASRFVGGQQQLQMLSGNYDNSVGLAWINAQELQVRRATEAAGALGRLSDSTGIAMQGLGSLGSGLNSFGQQVANIAAGGGASPGGGIFGSLLGGFGRMVGGISPTSPFWAPNSTLGNFLVTGFSSGGYTGPGGRDDVAGLVHRGEVVWSQEDVARWGGAGNVDAMRRGLRGYAEGGIVGDRRRVVGVPASSAGGERVRVIETVKEVRIAYDEQGNPYQRMREIAREESDIIASQRADEVRHELPNRINAWQRNPYKRGA
jgi:hypothetical protein